MDCRVEENVPCLPNCTPRRRRKTSSSRSGGSGTRKRMLRDFRLRGQILRYAQDDSKAKKQNWIPDYAGMTMGDWSTLGPSIQIAARFTRGERSSEKVQVKASLTPA